jgi:hypothetical protein
MKIRFGSDEWYPVYYELKEGEGSWRLDIEIDLTQEEIEDFRKAYQHFEQWQDRLRTKEKTYAKT